VGAASGFVGAASGFVGAASAAIVNDNEQHSYRNIKRAGFSEAYLRENWIPINR